MKSRQSSMVASAKAPTGIFGFDEITRGGLPHGRTTLVTGGAGCGKTIFAMQFLVHGVRQCKEPGIFVAFEESPQRIIANFKTFGWQLETLIPKMLFFMDAQLTTDFLQAGDFDLSGMLASLGSLAKTMRARRIVLDALDVILAHLPDAVSRRREVYRIHDWLLSSGLTGVITAKSASDDKDIHGVQPFGFVQFMVDCAVELNHRMIYGVSQRNLRVQKYRGSSFDENESPFVISKDGFDVSTARPLVRTGMPVTTERVSSGVTRLDTMLGGGYYRASSVLITGFPGTAKTTLCGAFADAACQRGERTVYVSFDSDGPEVVRNLSSVAIRLDRHMKSGLLCMISARTIIGSSETLLVRIKALAKEHNARCLVIDPVSTLSKSGNEVTAHGVAERLLDWCKTDGITLLCSSLLDDASNQQYTGTPLQISTLSDTWIHLNYLAQSGERNRGISIMKSRGTAHSNQVRELLLSDSGIHVADIYTLGGEVLMGTLRWEKEAALRAATELAEAEGAIKRLRLETEEAEINVRLQSLQRELRAKQAEVSLAIQAIENRRSESSLDLARVQQLRGADPIVEDNK